MCTFLTYFVFITKNIYKLGQIKKFIQFPQTMAKILPKVCYAEICLNKQVWNVVLHLKTNDLSMILLTLYSTMSINEHVLQITLTAGKSKV